MCAYNVFCEDVWRQEIINHLAMIVPRLLQLLEMVFAVLVDSYNRKKHKKVMLILAFFVFSLIAQNYAENTLAASEQPHFLYNTIATIKALCNKKPQKAAEVAYALADRCEEYTALVTVRTFGEFDVFIDGKLVSFPRAKAKELLAYLVDKHGADSILDMKKGTLRVRPEMFECDMYRFSRVISMRSMLTG